MIANDVLVFPDTSEAAWRCIKTSALYSDHVHSLNVFDRRTAERMLDAFGSFSELVPAAPLIMRWKSYFQWVLTHCDDLDCLETEGVLLSLQSRAHWPTDAEKKKAMAYFADRGKGMDREQPAFPENVAEVLDAAFPHFPPSFSDLDLLAPFIRGAKKEEDIDTIDLFLRDVDATLRVSMVWYLLLVSVIAEQQGLMGVTWSEAWRDAAWSVQTHYRSGSKKTRRGGVEQGIAQLVISRHVPRVDRLSVQELLRLRSKRKAEIECFRAGIGALALEVDLEASGEDIELQMNDIVTARVDPALLDLRRAFQEEKYRVATEAAGGWRSVAASTVPAVISVMAGAPLDIAAALAAIGPMAAVVSGIMKHRGTIKGTRAASPWSLVFDVREEAEHS